MHVVIIGNGVAGIATAIRLRELDPQCQITVVSGESRHHFSRPALMYIYMGHMRYQDTKPYEDWFWEEQRIDLMRAWVTAIDADAQTIHTHDQQTLRYDNLVLATGSKPNKFGWPGQDLPGVQGLYDLMDLKALYENTENARRGVIVGGGLIGIELAEMLMSRGIDVTFLVREASYWDRVLPSSESAMINELIRSHGIDLRLQEELTEIQAGPNGRVAAVTTKSGDRIDCELVGLTAGVSPNIDLVREHAAIETGRGILVDDRLRASAPHVFAAGDCAEIKTGGERNMLQQVWYTGKMQGRHVAETICGADEPYSSGIWYNSAKFFDLEYQVYGQVNMNVPGEENLYWQHPTKAIAFRLVHLDGRVIGFNLMGLRYRHRVCERWIAEERSLAEVLSALRDGNFDPEFFSSYEPQIVAAFTEQLAEQGHLI